MRASSNKLFASAALVMLVAMQAACRPKPAEPPPSPPPPPPEVPARAEASAAAVANESTIAEPAIDTMALAQAPAKLGVPVDLRYRFDAEVADGRPVTLHLAAVPRVAGSNLEVSIKQEPGIDARLGALSVQKASADAAYRQQLSVTRSAGGPAVLRVLVTMDLPEGSAFGFYSVPFAPAVSALKSDQAEQR
jgi:hypothetical protein